MIVPPFVSFFTARPAPVALPFAWTEFREHFERQAHRPLPLRINADEVEARRLRALPRACLGALLRCLAVFQKGETGEGRIAHEIDAARFDWIDDSYRAALKLFVAEEGRHARLLAVLLLGLGGRLLVDHISQSLFILARRLLGVRLKLLVLATAEVAGIVMYTLLARRLPLGRCRNLLREIIRDEWTHLRFHAAFFRAWIALTRVAWLRPILRRAFTMAWRSLLALACMAMLFTLRRELPVLGLRFSCLFRAFARKGKLLEKMVWDGSGG